MADWRKRTDENGGRNYQYFREMFPDLDDQIVDQFKLGFGATILYEDMTPGELGSLIYNAIAIGFVSGKQQSAAASAVWDQAVEACISIVAEGVKWEPEEFYSDTHIKASNETAYLLAKALRSLKRSQSQTGTDDLCQAKSSTQGETVSAAPLQSGIIAGAIRDASWKPDQFHIYSDEAGRIFVSADGQPIMDFTARIALELGEALVTLAASSQSEIEEPERSAGDTESAASAERSLTPHKINQESDNG